VLTPVQIRRLLARTLKIALDGSPANAQLIERWAHAEAPEACWITALTWDGVGSAIGWALAALDLKGVAPGELDTFAGEAYHEARQRCVEQVADLTRIGVELAAQDVPAVALKGSALLLGNVAPALGIRWMSDIDLLVPEPKVEQAAWVLESLDYARESARDPDAHEVFRPYHDTFTGPDGLVVELHWRLGPQRWGRASAADAWFAQAGPSEAEGIQVPAAADLFWHFLIHDARNHAWSSGSLRAALDLALAARARGFSMTDVLRRLDEDPRPEPLFEAIADAANLSPILAAEMEPSGSPRYLRLARWRDAIGRRHWKTERVSEAIAWGATLDRARRFGSWKTAVDRAMRIIPEAAPGSSLGAMVRRFFLTVRHTAFIGALAVSHLISIPAQAASRMKPLPRPAPPGTP
jgi:hypothetical protein